MTHNYKNNLSTKNLNFILTNSTHWKSVLVTCIRKFSRDLKLIVLRAFEKFHVIWNWLFYVHSKNFTWFETDCSTFIRKFHVIWNWFFYVHSKISLIWNWLFYVHSKMSRDLKLIVLCAFENATWFETDCSSCIRKFHVIWSWLFYVHSKISRDLKLIVLRVFENVTWFIWNWLFYVYSIICQKHTRLLYFTFINFRVFFSTDVKSKI